MKKLLTLSVACIAFAANAQNIRGIEPAKVNVRSTCPVQSLVPHAPKSHMNSMAKITAITPFFTDTFKSTSLTTGGWVASGNTPSAGTWKFTTHAASGPYSIDAINSTTAAGGWMLYDSDSIGAIFNNAPQIGTLTAPVISCSGHQYVGVRFEQYTRRFQDTFLIQVSNNGGTSWTSYPILPNMGLSSNDATENAELTTINITPTAGNQAAVLVRFYYSGAFVGGGYNWIVDDFQMVDLDPVDLGLSKSGVIMTLGAGNGYAPLGSEPKIFADTAFPVTEVYNAGGLPVSAVNVDAAIYSGSTQVYNKSVLFSNIPANAFDSLADFTQFPGFVPAGGQYTVAFNSNNTGDAIPADNVDTTVFNISDSALCVFAGYQESSKSLNPYWYQGSYYIHAATSSGRPNGTSYYMGSFFEIPNGTKKDTITSVSVCLAPGTAVGAQIQVELYKFNSASSSYDSKGRTFAKTLTAADISTSSNLVFTTLPMNIGTAKAFAIADAGNWVAVAMPVSPLPAQVILLAAAQAAAPANVVGRYGVSDSANGTSFSFGSDLANNTHYSVFSDVPAVVVNFGDARKLLSVGNIAGLSIGSAFPNPANTVLNIPVAASASTPVNIGIYNAMGQLLKSQSLGVISAGQSKTAVFSTADLASGIYVYIIESNGQRVTNRVSVMH